MNIFLICSALGRKGSPPIICNMAFYHPASRGKKRQEEEEEVQREAMEMLTVGETLEV